MSSEAKIACAIRHYKALSGKKKLTKRDIDVIIGCLIDTKRGGFVDTGAAEYKHVLNMLGKGKFHELNLSQLKLFKTRRDQEDLKYGEIKKTEKWSSFRPEGPDPDEDPVDYDGDVWDDIVGQLQKGNWWSLNKYDRHLLVQQRKSEMEEG